MAVVARGKMGICPRAVPPSVENWGWLELFTLPRSPPHPPPPIFFFLLVSDIYGLKMKPSLHTLELILKGNMRGGENFLSQFKFGVKATSKPHAPRFLGTTDKGKGAF